VLTGNTDTVHCTVMLDLQVDGPTVVEIPPGSGPGTVNDAFFRFVVDMGAPGPDKGRGGKYLIVPPGYEGALPKEGYFIARSPSYSNLVILRGFLVDGKPDAASKMFREGFKVYPLNRATNPPMMEFINGSKVAYNTVHANNFEFYRELDNVIQKEPLDFIDPELREDLSDERPGERSGEGLLVGGAVRPADALRAADFAAVSQQEQQARQADGQRRRVGRPLLRSEGASRQGSELDRNRPRQGLVHAPPVVRSARSLVQQDLATRRDRRGEVTRSAGRTRTFR